MKKRNIPQNKKSERLPRRENAPIPWRYCLLTLICGLLLVGGFFFAAQQHFSAIDYGIKNAKLRRQKETLEAEQQRIKLAREVTLSPAQIKKAARKIGMREMTASNIEVFDGKSSPDKIADAKTNRNSAERAPETKKDKEVKSETRDDKKATTVKNDSKKSESKTDKKEKTSAR